jgi:hypothetical protein
MDVSILKQRMWGREVRGMNEIISKTVVDRIVLKYGQSVTSETTQQEMLQVIGAIVYEAINSINKDTLSDNTFSAIRNGLAKKGIR